MRSEGDQPGGSEGHGGSSPQARPRPLQALHGGGAADDRPPPTIRLVREYKGPTVADLMRDDALVAALPGRVRSVLQQLERGDFGGADSALDAASGRILSGPFAPRRWRRRLLLAMLAVAAAAAARYATFG
jgi:hypothetical protein